MALNVITISLDKKDDNYNLFDSLTRKSLAYTYSPATTLITYLRGVNKIDTLSIDCPDSFLLHDI